VTNLPTEDDVKNLINIANSVRDKAIISTLYESGCRIGEFLNVQMKDLEFDDFGVIMLVTGKTGPRRIRIVSSVPYLSAWIDLHPRKNLPDAPLWLNIGCTNHHKAMRYQNVRKLLKNKAKMIKLEKPVNPHAFRKARATHLASVLTEAQMCEYFGWIQGSDMPSTYVHLSGKNIDKAILKMHGVNIQKEQKKDKFKTKKCSRCYHENPPSTDYCLRCRLPLNEKAAIELEKRKKDFLYNVITPDLVEDMIEKRVKQILKDHIAV
jgi:ribosomal protein L40E